MQRLLHAPVFPLLLRALPAPAIAGGKNIVVGCDLKLKPFEFRGEDGRYSGFDIDIGEALASAMNLEFTQKPMAFEELLQALPGSGKVGRLRRLGDLTGLEHLGELVWVKPLHAGGADAVTEFDLGMVIQVSL